MGSTAASVAKKRIGERLIEEGLINPKQLGEALAQQKETGRKLVEVLIDLGHLGVEEVAKFLSNQPGTPSIELRHYTIPSEVCDLVPREFVIKHEAIPIDRLSKLLTVGMAFPLDQKTIDELTQMTGLKVKALLCRSEDIRAAVERYYPKDAEAASAPADAATVAAELKLSGVARLIRGIDALPTLPETVQRVKELTDAPDSSIEEIAAVISNDPPTAARLLQLANSPAYGFESKVGSVERATTLLGLKETFMVVLSSAVIDLTQKSKGFDYESFWDESLATAQVCRILAKVHGKRSDGVLSTAGLLAGIGRFALAQAVAKRYAKIDASLRGVDLVQAEEEELGIAHPEAGYELATHWGLPEEIAMGIRFHLAPERADKHQATVATVGLATTLSRLKLEGAESAEDALAQEDMTLALADITAAQALQAYKTLISGE